MSFWLTPMRKPPVSNLLKMKRSVGLELVPGVEDGALALGFGQGGEAADHVDPVAEGEVRGAGRVGQDEGDGLRQVADDGIGFLEQPQGDGGALGGPFAQ